VSRGVAFLSQRTEEARAAARPRQYGRVEQVVGMSIEVAGISAAVGDGILLLAEDGPVQAEVVGVRGGRSVCVALGEVSGLRAGTRVTQLDGPIRIVVGAGMLGRVVDGLGRPLDQGPPLEGESVSIHGRPPHPLRRGMVVDQLTLGVRVLDGMIPCGKGQRLGIFAGSGVGKSSLLSMIARGTEAEVSVVALIGERGREVAEFIERDLGPEGLARSVVVVATSDEPAMVRIRAAFTATRIAEWFRDRGDDVVLMMDSVTRFAMAQREVGLAAGEPPATRGYPPSVFGLLPRLLERAGRDEHGSITGLYTVLVEGDDINEPIADTARSILDGHVRLARSLAEAGHYPAVDVLESISRVAPAITPPEVLAAGAEIRKLLAAWRDARDLIEIDAYVPGTNPVVDRAVALRPAIDSFLRQSSSEVADLSTTRAALEALAATPVAAVEAPVPALPVAPAEGQAALALPGAAW